MVRVLICSDLLKDWANPDSRHSKTLEVSEFASEA
jgi:hypothetical protein